MKKYVFTARDETKLVCSLWDDVKRPVGVVQIIHGMDEHVLRYDRFAKFLNRHGYIVFGDDHRAHGRTAGTPDEIGVAHPGQDLFAETVDDELEIIGYLKNKYALPLFLFGHSYGSFITQALMEKTDLAAAGVCLSGSARYPRGMAAIGALLAWIGVKTHGAAAPARLIEFFSPIRGSVDGGSPLSRDADQVRQHEADPMRVKYFSYGFYLSLFRNLMRLHGDGNPEVPLLIISGGRDIVSRNSRLSMALYREYQAHNFQNLTLIIYPDARHELLMELNYQQVQQDILDFFNSITKKL